jgi:hypothetical protein
MVFRLEAHAPFTLVRVFVLELSLAFENVIPVVSIVAFEFFAIHWPSIDRDWSLICLRAIGCRIHVEDLHRLSDDFALIVQADIGSFLTIGVLPLEQPIALQLAPDFLQKSQKSGLVGESC